MRPIGFPLGQAAPQILLDTGGGLVALFGTLGEQLHDEFGNSFGDRFQPLAGRRRPPRDMAVDPFHGIGGREGQGPCEHLIKGDAERIEVAAGIDRAVHPAGLFGRHIGQRAGNGFGRLERLAFARQSRGDAKAGEANVPVGAVHQYMGRLEILVNETALVDPAERRGDA